MRKLIFIPLTLLTALTVWSTWNSIFGSLHGDSNYNDMLSVILCNIPYIMEANLSVSPLTLISSMYYILIVCLGTAFVYTNSMAYPYNYSSMVLLRFGSRGNYLKQSLLRNLMASAQFCTFIAAILFLCQLPLLKNPGSQWTAWSHTEEVKWYLMQALKMILFFHTAGTLGEFLRRQFHETSAVIILVLTAALITIIDILSKETSIITFAPEPAQLWRIGIFIVIDGILILLCRKYLFSAMDT